MALFDVNKLKDYFNNKIVGINTQIQQLNDIPKGLSYTDGEGNIIQLLTNNNELYTNYKNICGNLDDRIVDLNNQINLKKLEIVGLGSAANAVGCGTTDVGTYEIKNDTVTYSKYDLNPNVDTNPFNSTDYTLSSGLLGVGYTNKPETIMLSSLSVGVGTTGTIVIDGSGVGIGSYSAGIGTTGPGTPSVCTSYASSMSTLTNEIITLRSEISDLNIIVNIFKNEKTQLELQNYGTEKSKVILQNEANRVAIALTFLNNTTYSSFM